MAETKAIRIDGRDNVAVAVCPLASGEAVLGVTLVADVPAGHKFALAGIAEGASVVKYGSAIGHATRAIGAGEHVHTQNLKTNLSGRLSYTYTPQDIPPLAAGGGTFMGYRRKGGVGIRNEVWIVNTVGCVNKLSERLAALANERFAGRTDGVFAYTHPYGCSQLGDDHGATQRFLAGLVKHPNAAAVLVLGLGCENNNIAEFQKALGEWDDERVRFIAAQDYDDDVQAGLDALDALTAYAARFKREAADISELVIGLKCGGSDGFSGITANPLVGRLSDMVVAHGGTTVLTEVPEMFGAETLLMARCETEELFGKTVGLINNFKDYFTRHNQEIYENPSPGNKAGGISTLEDKSLGCTQKGGTSAVKDVLAYGERVTKRGLNLLEGPGNDIVAISALTAAGCHIILFTTGRGTPLGAPAPTVKISSNSALASRKRGWIDFDAGTLVNGETMDAASERLMRLVLDIAEGKQTRSEENGYREIAIFKDGVTL